MGKGYMLNSSGIKQLSCVPKENKGKCTKSIKYKIQSTNVRGLLGLTWGGSREGRNETCSLGGPVLRSRPTVHCLHVHAVHHCAKNLSQETALHLCNAMVDSLLHNWSMQRIICLWANVWSAHNCWRNLIFWIYSPRVLGPSYPTLAGKKEGD